MLEIPRRVQRLSVALPASFTKDIPHLREKTSRVGLIARTLAIFRVDKAIIYNDSLRKPSNDDGRLFNKILDYIEAPQYLRRMLFSRDLDLQFAGILPPLRLPSHPNTVEPRKGLLREALVVATGRPSTLNAGFGRPVLVDSRLNRSERVTIRLTRVTPRLEAELVEPTRLPIYWGFRVTRTDFTLGELVRREKPDLTISTSRNGTPVREVWNELDHRWKSARSPLVLFGSPSEGIPEILAKEGTTVERVADFNLNVIPDQGVETVRTEEATLAALSELNLLGEK